ncbi:hypothetical protein [Chryseobacterium indoltheticum]
MDFFQKRQDHYIRLLLDAAMDGKIEEVYDDENFNGQNSVWRHFRKSWKA